MKKILSRDNKVLLSEMVRTDFKLRYQSSILGYVWSLLRPLFLFIILYTVFTKFLRIGRGVPNYAVSLLLGMVLWSFFVDATSGALQSIVGRGSLLRKINIPRYLIPISTIASALINLFLNLIVVSIFIFFAKNKPLSWSVIIIFPLLVAELVVFAVAVGFFLSALYVKYRDMEHIWDIFRQALFYTIPIVYPLTMVTSVEVQKILILNPIAQIIQDARYHITYSGTPTINSLYANSFIMLVPLGIIAVALIIGSVYFRKRSKYFAEDI